MDEKELNEILPVPTLEEMREQIETELEEDNFKIKNLRNGKIFKALEMIFLKAINELYKLLRTVVTQIFITDAKGIWLDIKAADFGRKRKNAIRAEGKITVGRNSTDGQAKIIKKGNIFKTDMDMYGKELRYISQENVVMDKEVLKVLVPVKAESSGAIYNAPPGMIKYSLQHISGIDYITNEIDWLTREGTDTEEDESLRERSINAWDELATQPTAGTYKSHISKIEGVIVVNIDDMHPRGQGTIDIVITGANGLPTETLLEKVREKADEIKGPYDNVLVYGPDPIYQDIDITLMIDNIYGDENKIRQEAMNVIRSLFKVSEGNKLNKLYKSKINSDLMSIENVVNVVINKPQEDILLDMRKIIMPGEITLNIVKENKQ